MNEILLLRAKEPNRNPSHKPVTTHKSTGLTDWEGYQSPRTLANLTDFNKTWLTHTPLPKIDTPYSCIQSDTIYYSIIDIDRYLYLRPILLRT